MERNYMRPDVLVDFEFLREQEAEAHDHENPEILFVLEGSMNVRVGDQEYDLGSEDFILINANRTHSYRAGDRFLAVRFQLSAEKVRSVLHQSIVLFWCCSVLEKTRAYEDVRRTLKEILLCSLNRGRRDEFFISSLHFRLLSQLTGNFLLANSQANPEGSGADRMEQILAYIRANYHSPISLQDVANEMFLSPTYLSKYIRRQSGKGFVELINSVRLTHALADLLYTDVPVTRIALDNGFASVAAFNKVVRDAYGMTPTEYRKKKYVGNDLKGIDKDRNELYKKAAAYLYSHSSDQGKAQDKALEVSLLLHSERGKSGVSSALPSQILNAGKAQDLLEASTQRQILYCKDQLGIRHVRFWNILEPGMYLDRTSRGKHPNFGKLDEILDFLVGNRLTPYIELRSKHLRLLGTADRLLRSRKDLSEDFVDGHERIDFFNELFSHLIRRYGPEETGRWLFDYTIGNDTSFEDGFFRFIPLDDTAWDQYLFEFSQIASLLRTRIPGAQIGGAGFPVQHFGLMRLKDLLTAWKARPLQPDFISITSYPYQIVCENGVWYEKRRTDMDFVR